MAAQIRATQIKPQNAFDVLYFPMFHSAVKTRGAPRHRLAMFRLLQRVESTDYCAFHTQVYAFNLQTCKMRHASSAGSPWEQVCMYPHVRPFDSGPSFCVNDV